MGEEALEDLDPSIIIIDISEDAPKEAVTTEARPGGGMYLTGQLRQSITVTIAVEIHEANTIHRQLVLSKIMRWGSGGQYLHTSYRPEQRLYIDSIEAASVSALKWTDTLEIKLTAYAMISGDLRSDVCSSDYISVRGGRKQLFPKWKQLKQAKVAS